MKNSVHLVMSVFSLKCCKNQSWQKVEINTSMFTPDITPLILAAHKNNYEILKILLDRGATVPTPHDIRFVFVPVIG